VDGEVLVLPSYDPTARPVPLSLQVLEVDVLDSLQFEYGGRKIHSGVEVDDYWRPRAYWVRPDPLRAPYRVEAERVIHLFGRRRPQQIRGVSELAGVLMRIRDAGEYIDSELVAARVAACFSGYVVTKDPSAFLGRRPERDGDRLETMEPGIFQYLAPGEEPVFGTPGRPNSKAGELVTLQQRLAGAGMGMSYELMSRDMSQVNYSSARQAHLEDRRLFEPLQQFLIAHFCRPVWAAFVDAAVLAGKLKIPDYERNRERYLRANWVAPGWSWIDPLKEAQAYDLLLSRGLTTLEELAAGRGRDWAELLEQRKRERDYEVELGLDLSGQQPEGGEDDGDDEGDEPDESEG